MDVQIKPVLRSNCGFEDAREVQLIGLPEMRDAILNSILQHPLNRGVLVGDSELTIMLKVAVGGKDYCDKVPWASIAFDSYLTSGLPIVLDFHLIKYLGDDRDYPFGIPSPNVFMARGINWTVLRSTLLHEFSHLLDALNPEFGYSVTLKKSLTGQESHRLQGLWNDSINRRLAGLLGSDYTIRPSEESSSDLSGYTYPELVRIVNSRTE